MNFVAIHISDELDASPWYVIIMVCMTTSAKTTYDVHVQYKM